jgi:hypothetical protein
MSATDHLQLLARFELRRIMIGDAMLQVSNITIRQDLSQPAEINAAFKGLHTQFPKYWASSLAMWRCRCSIASHHHQQKFLHHIAFDAALTNQQLEYIADTFVDAN